MEKPSQPPAKKGDVDLTHMPRYIKQAPWYVEQKDQPVLNHQRNRNEGGKVAIDTWYRKGADPESVVTKYRKGACENCGSMTHKRKECTERPRKVGAKFTGKDFAKDEFVDNIDLNYEGKRDRWNGYNPDQYKQVITEWSRKSEIQKEKKAQDLHAKMQANQNKGDTDSDSQGDDSDKETGEAQEQVFAIKDPRVKTTIGQLRIREDTAKYLRNLDPNSAPYDGKSRSMKENPNPAMPDEQQMFRGDNYARMTGDYLKLMNQEGFIMEASQVGGVDLNNMAMPSQVELAYKQFKEKKEMLEMKKRRELEEKYGVMGKTQVGLPEEVRETLKAQREDLIEAEAEAEEQSQAITVSKYEEDKLESGHSEIWGSYWHQHFGWGYNCCYGTNRYHPCRGQEGKKDAIIREYQWELEEKKKQEELMNQKLITKLPNKFGQIEAEEKEVPAEQQQQQQLQQEKKQESGSDSSSSSDSESDSESSSDSDEEGNRKRDKKWKEKKGDLAGKEKESKKRRRLDSD